MFFLAMFPSVFERLVASGERLGAVLERPGSVLGRLGTVLVAFKVVLDVKMSFESVQKPKTLKNHCFLKIFGLVPRRLGASWGVWGASWGRLESVVGVSQSVLGASWAVLGCLDGLLDRLRRQDEL